VSYSVSLRIVAILAILVPSQGFADTPTYKLLQMDLEPLGEASDLGIRGTLPTTSDGQTTSSWRDQGSARELQGLVCVEHVFVDEYLSSWTVPRRLDSLDASSMALADLKKRASAIGVSLDWRETQRSYTSPMAIPLEVREHEWTAAAVRQTATTERRFLPPARCPVRECDEQLAILHVMKPGRSYALPSVASRDAGVERVVMFQRYVEIQYYGEESPAEDAGIVVSERPSAFVHEVLHVFGAQDMYIPEARRLVAAERYPDEVMLRGHGPLRDLSISEYTAYHIGWSDKEPPPLPRVW
jgi:hypothetical protein